jgi:hypothetical protein
MVPKFAAQDFPASLTLSGPTCHTLRTDVSTIVSWPLPKGGFFVCGAVGDADAERPQCIAMQSP